MLKPGGKFIQDFGYDVIKLDGVLSSHGFKGDLADKKTSIQKMFCNLRMVMIGEKVLQNVDQFPLDGKNRWENDLF